MIVFETPDDQDLKAIRRYFLHLGERVCAMLNQAGYSYCDGLIMASNHQWCLSKKEWQDNFSQWIEQASPDTILELNVFFDIRATYGDSSLVDDIQTHTQRVLAVGDLTPLERQNLTHVLKRIAIFHDKVTADFELT